jgi:hypothetical protein
MQFRLKSEKSTHMTRLASTPGPKPAGLKVHTRLKAGLYQRGTSNLKCAFGK